MLSFYNLPIKAKVKRLIFIGVSTALFFMVVTLSIIDYNQSKSSLKKQMEIQAKIIATQVKVAIEFNDEAGAKSILDAFDAESTIQRIIIYLEDNSIYSSYDKPNTEIFFPSFLRQEEVIPISFNYIPEITDIEDINLEKKAQISIEINLTNFYQERLKNILVMVIIAFICLFLTLMVTGRIIKQIVLPILQLAKTAKKVADNKNYQTRAKIFGNDEVGKLTENFNEMLSQIQSHEEELEDKVLKRTEELEEALLTAETANRVKSEFVANMTHELRTPMNAIINMNRFALETELTHKQRNYLTQVDTSSAWLLSLIQDTLDFSKIESGKLKLDSIEFSLTKLFNRFDIFANDVEKKGLELIFQYPLNIDNYLIADDIRLSQVLINLMSNSIKFTEKGEIIVLIKQLEETNKQVKLFFSVTDTGIGISNEYKKDLFNSFSQADASTTREYGGTGLGLAISQRLINLMGGTIQVESELDKGSRFFFTLTLDKSTKLLPNPLITYKAAIENLNILLLNSNKAYEITLVNLFSELNISVKTVSKLQSAVTELENNDIYDLTLINWQTIKTDKQASFLQNIFKNKAIIIMATALEYENIMIKNDYLASKNIVSKPLKYENLINTISIAVNNKSCLSIDALEITKQEPIFNKMGQLNILLVEDNEINQHVACELLERKGANVTVANNGKEAVDILIQQSFDLVLMDIQMPIMDGYEATTAIRKNLTKQVLPIVAMTAHAMTEDKERCFSAGMNDHLAKPIEPDALYQVLAKYLSKTPSSQPIEVEIDSSIVEISTIKAFPEIEGIDFQDGMLRLGQNKTLYLKLLQMFIKEHQYSVDDIKQKLAAGNIEGAKLKAHTLKGVGANLGAKALSSIASELEIQFKEKDQPANDPKLLVLSDNIARFIDGIDRISGDGEKKPELPDTQVLDLKSQLREFGIQVTQHDFSATRKIKVLIKQAEEEKDISHKLKHIEQTLEQFDYQTASQLITALIKFL